MKRIYTALIVILLFGVLVATGYRQNDVKTLFKDNFTLTDCTIPTDSVQQTSTGYYQLHTIAAQPDTMRSKAMFKGAVQCTQTFYVGCDSIAGTTNVKVEYGIYRGPEAGWYYYAIDTLASDDEIDVANVNEFSWGTKQISDIWCIRLCEIGNQRNKLWIREIEFYEN